VLDLELSYPVPEVNMPLGRCCVIDSSRQWRAADTMGEAERQYESMEEKSMLTSIWFTAGGILAYPSISFKCRRPL
jgi:hypothetical protein